MKHIITAELKDGDQLFQRNVFNIRDINTYMSPIVYFGINFWNLILKRPITPANHVGTLYYVNGEWYVYEAKLKFVPTRLIDKMNNKDIVGLYVKRYMLDYLDRYAMKYHANKLIGIKYDFISIIKQFFRKLFNNNVNLETNPRKFKNKKVNCSEGNAEQLQAGGISFNNTKSIDPDDLWKDDRSELVGYLKKI